MSGAAVPGLSNWLEHFPISMHRTCGGEIISTFVWREAVYSIGDSIPVIWDRSRRAAAS